MRSLLVCALIAGSGCATYSVRRSALVPHVAPVTTNGQPMSEPVALSVGTPNVGALGSPSEGSGGDSGLYIPRLEMNGGLRGRIGDATLGLIADYGSGDDAMATADDMPRPEGDTYGIGVMFAYSFGHGPFRFGLELDVLRYSVPWKETWTCVEHCEVADMPSVVTGRDDVAVAALGMVPSYQLGRWTLFSGLTLRNHPTIDKGDVINFELTEHPVEGGPLNIVVSTGAEVLLAPGLHAGLVVFVPLADDPVAYAPTLSAQVTLGLPTTGP